MISFLLRRLSAHHGARPEARTHIQQVSLEQASQLCAVVCSRMTAEYSSGKFDFYQVSLGSLKRKGDCEGTV